MAKNASNEFARRAQGLLNDRLESVTVLGDLLTQRAEREAALAQTDADIDKAVAKCLESGWTAKELDELGAPRAKSTTRSRRAPRTAVIEPNPNHNSDQSNASPAAPDSAGTHSQAADHDHSGPHE